MPVEVNTMTQHAILSIELLPSPPCVARLQQPFGHAQAAVRRWKIAIDAITG